MEYRIGQIATISKTVSDNDVKQFAKLVGDENPIHIDDEFAKQSQFGKRIVHGMFGASLISAVLGMKLPGPGAIYLSQFLQFTAPVFIGDKITAQVKVVKILKNKPIITMETNCINQNDEIIIKGEAVVKI